MQFAWAWVAVFWAWCQVVAWSCCVQGCSSASGMHFTIHPPSLPLPPSPVQVAAALCEEGIPAVALHGGLTQGERESALREFSAGTVKVLVATDVASRGLDIKGIGHVVNMDLPKTFEDYVHRIGSWGLGMRGTGAPGPTATGLRDETCKDGLLLLPTSCA